MSKKLIVFRCKWCIEDLKEYNPYVHDGKDVSIDEILLIKTSLEKCENACSNLDIHNYAPIVIEPVMRGYCKNDGYDLLVELAMEHALSKGYTLYMKVWEDDRCREEAIADYHKITDVEQIGSMFYGACQEIVIDDGEEEHTIAHYEDEEDECYILEDILNFIKE